MACAMRASDFDLLIVPRIGGAGEGDWPSRWRAKLSTATFVHPADPADRRRDAWTEAVAAAARKATRPALFVGHGLGAAAIADAAKALEGADVRGAFLVAPPDERGLGRLANADWTPARAPLPWPSLVVASRNDPYAAYDAAAALASDWGADLVDAGEAGGLDAASGHGPWPEGLMRLAAFIKGIGRSGAYG
jgi:predicted alpha/beta hydrolase family esterase